MGALNLAHVLETGSDLAGNPRERIARAAADLRVVIVPLANPDGRERVEREDLIGVSDEDQPYYCQGRYENGTNMSHPLCKQFHPMRPTVEFLGGYFNDAGVNIQTDLEFTSFLAAETKALLALVVSEVPEAVANMHSCGLGPYLVHHRLGMPPGYEVRMAQVGEACRREFLERGLRPEPPYPYRANDGVYCLDSMFHWLTGCLPIQIECPHGLSSHPYTREEILEVQMTFHEVFLTMLAEEGLRPPFPEKP